MKPSPSAAAEDFQLNANHYLAVSAAVEQILGHELFENVMAMEPLALGSGGTEACFDKESYDLAIQSSMAEYRAAGSLWWIKVLKGGGFDKVPVNPAAVQQLKTFYFHEPTIFPEPIVIGIGSDDDPMQLKGKLERLSPEELEHALLLRIAERMSSNAGPDELLEWRRVTLTVTLIFRAFDNLTDRLWHSISIREKLVMNYSTMARSAYQRIFEIVEFKALYEKLSGPLNNQRLADLYNEKADMAVGAGQDAITASFVEMSVSVHRLCLSIPEAKRCIAEAEEAFMKHSPFNSVTKLYTICSRAKGIPALLWVLNSMLDAVHVKYIAASEFSLRALQAPSGRSVIDLFLLKLKMKDYLLINWLDTLAIAPQTKVRLRESLESHSSYRVHYGKPEDTSTDLTWQAGWKSSDISVSRFLGALLYAPEHDVALKTGLRAGKAPDEIVQIGSIAEQIDRICEMLTAEHAATTKLSANAAAPTAISDEETDNGEDHVIAVTGNKDQALSSSCALVGGAVDLSLVSDSRQSKIKKFMKSANEFARTHVLMIVEEQLDSATKLRAAFDTCPMAQHTPSEHHKTIVFYDIKNAGEAGTNPTTRLPSFRSTHYKKMMSAFLMDTTNNGFHVPPEHVFCICDGFKAGLERELMNVFVEESKTGQKKAKQLELVHQVQRLVYNEE